jgi:hypothetical protein
VQFADLWGLRVVVGGFAHSFGLVEWGPCPRACGRLRRRQAEQHRIPHATSCRALGVSQSWLYKWRGGALPATSAAICASKASPACEDRLKTGPSHESFGQLAHAPLDIGLSTEKARRGGILWHHQTPVPPHGKILDARTATG